MTTDSTVAAARLSGLRRALHALFPPQPYASPTEKVLSATAALAAILLLAWVTSRYLSAGPTLFMVASMGASAVLLFATSHSPLAQPWAFVGGHIVSAFIGVTCHLLIPDTTAAIAIAVALSILAMHFLHCLHPPGGGTALMPVLGDPEIQQLGYGFVLTPVALNAVLLLALVLAINNLLPGRRYPVFAHHVPKGKGPHELLGWPLGKFGITQDDLESALKDMETYIDVAEDDLEQIYAKAMLHSHRRRMGEIRVRDIMERDVVAAEYGDELEQVWDRMREHRVKGVPVVDRARRVIGVVTIVDFLKLVGPCADEHLYPALVSPDSPDAKRGGGQGRSGGTDHDLTGHHRARGCTHRFAHSAVFRARHPSRAGRGRKGQARGDDHPVRSDGSAI